jgi:hypothetical protein
VRAVKRTHTESQVWVEPRTSGGGVPRGYARVAVTAQNAEFVRRFFEDANNAISTRSWPA